MMKLSFSSLILFLLVKDLHAKTKVDSGIHESLNEEFFRPARILEASYEQHRYMKARDSEERFNTRNDGKASRHSDKATSESAQKQNIDAATHFIHDNKKQMDSNEFKKVSQHITRSYNDAQAHAQQKMRMQIIEEKLKILNHANSQPHPNNKN